MSAAPAIAVLAIALAATRMCHAIRPYRSCTMAELEGIRRDCFYDFESKLSETPSRSIHVELHEKCNDSAIASYPVMRDCITVNLERRGCVTDEGLMRRFALTKKAHEHLCSTSSDDGAKVAVLRALHPQPNGSQCYYLQFNFYHVRTYIEEQVSVKCNGRF
uniref:SUEL-type lectin domain-containing protein n=1 Tax=Macrostomum lignano TaxID=282301 RepID=A0A1I8ITU0_9PLAT